MKLLNRLLVALLGLLPGETLGLGFTSQKKFTRSYSEFAAKRRTKNANGRDRQPTCLTSIYVEARPVSNSRPLSWLPSRFVRSQYAPLRWAFRRLQKRGGGRLLPAVALVAIVMCAPAFSPARASTAVRATASAARGLAPAVPFSGPSRALGTFNLLPTRAELELCFRLLYAACAGACVGLERASADRPAGVRTMALVGLGACTFTVCGVHGFLPHVALGHAPGSPLLANVKCDLSRTSASVASGVGFIGAGAIHQSRRHGEGDAAQNVVAGLATAAAIWVSAAVGIASAVGLYSVGAVATLATVVILKYARVPKEEEPGVSWQPRPLDVVEPRDGQPRSRPRDSTLFGRHFVPGYDPRDSTRLKEVFDPRFEQYLTSRLTGLTEQEILRRSHVLIEEEQEVIACNNSESEQGSLP